MVESKIEHEYERGDGGQSIIGMKKDEGHILFNLQ